MNRIYQNISWLPENSKMEILLGQEGGCPVTSVFCFIYSEDGNKVYLMENADKSRGLDVPGGHIEEGETPIEALHREVMEEVGLSIENVKYVGCQKITKEVPEEKYPHLVSCQNFYTATMKEVVTDDLEVDSVKRVVADKEEVKREFLSKKECYYLELYISTL